MQLIRSLSPVALASLAATALSSSGCAVEPDAIDTGVSIPLTTTTPNGAVYRLTGATFNFTGPDTRSVTSTGDEPAIDVALSPGSYQLELAAGWRMERLEPDGIARPVDATLVSQSVQQVTVLPGTLSQAYYQFLLAAEGGNGSVSISFGVTEAATLTGTLTLAPVGCDPATCGLARTVVTQIAFPPLRAQPVSTDAFELWLEGSGAVFTIYGDAPGTTTQQLAGSAVLMKLRRAGVTAPDELQELSIGIGNQASDGSTIDITIGPARVANGVDVDGFPLAPSELSFDAPVLVRNVSTTGGVFELQGTASLTYRSPTACGPEGCGTP
jgi:hypothetical protein